MLTKIISVLLSVIAAISTLVPAMLGAGRDGDLYTAAPPSDLTGLADYLSYVKQNGAPSLDSRTFLESMRPITQARRLLSGMITQPEDEAFIKVTVNDTIDELCSYVLENSGVDVVRLITHVPDNSGPAILLTEALRIDTVEMRRFIYSLRDKAREEGNTTLGALLYIFAVYLSVVEDVKIYTTPYEQDPDEYVITLDVTYRDGETQTMYAYLVIDPATGRAHSIDEKGILKLGMDMDIYDLLLYSTVNGWQRNFGYSILYDLFCDTSPLFNFVTRRFVFEYGGREWMIQIWKGNYALCANGAEMGVYWREPDSDGLFYKAVSDDEMLLMSCRLYHGDDLVMKKGPEYHWWLSAYKLSKTIYFPTELTLDFEITMPDEGMLAAFTAAMDAEENGDVAYTVDGLTVKGVW